MQHMLRKKDLVRIAELSMLALAVLLSACVTASVQTPDSRPSPATESQPLAIASDTATLTLTPSATLADTPTATLPPTASHTPTLTPTNTLTPTITPTPTYAFPTLTVLEQSHCRYGPGKAYLHAADLYAGDTAVISGVSPSRTWLWVKPDKIHYHCWVAASVVEVQGDLKPLKVAPVTLPKSSLYGPPEDVAASRNGDEVTVYWNEVWMTVDDFRGYMVEAWVCQNGAYFQTAVWTDKTQVTILDEPGCGSVSGGKLYAVEKHGYTDSVEIPWP
jgi:hypothetical protein